VFIYTREAHPGERVPHHDSFERKLAHARLLRDEVGIHRPILVDDLAGTAHQAYGGLPNMTWAVGRGGRLIYKANWTSAVNVEAFVTRFEQARAERAPGVPHTMYETEQIEFRRQDQAAFYERLRRNGQRAFDEFKRAEEFWRDHFPG